MGLSDSSPFSYLCMGRIIAIDFGRKRCGVAITDPLRISANPQPAVRTFQLLDFLKQYCAANEVDLLLMGYPRQNDGSDSESMKYIRPFLAKLKKELPGLPVEMVDERFTSVIAHREMLVGGFKKSDRQRRGFADEMSATIILTTWLESH